MAFVTDDAVLDATFGDDADDNGVTANDACCVCGGGAPEQTTTTPTAEEETTTEAKKRDSIPCSGKKTDFGTECQCAANCHTCTVGLALEIINGQCSVCKNMRALFEGTCIETDVCEGTAVKGSVQGAGNFNRKCVVKNADGEDGGDPPVCRGKTTEGSSPQPCTCSANCHTCQGEVCSVCKNKHALFGGDCIDDAACEEVGGTVAGAGNFNRRCEGQITPKTTSTTPAPCPTDPLAHFKDARSNTRLKAAATYVLDDGKLASVDNAAGCAAKCIAYGRGSECKGFDLKARGGQLRCNLLESSSLLGTSVVASEKYDLYDRSTFC